VYPLLLGSYNERVVPSKKEKKQTLIIALSIMVVGAWGGVAVVVTWRPTRFREVKKYRDGSLFLE